MNQLPNQHQKPTAKKAYKAPELQLYGDVREITNTLSTHPGTHTDTGHGPRTR